MSDPRSRDLEQSNGNDQHESVKSGEQNSINERKGEETLSPWDSYSHKWRKIFLASCVIGVTVDPLFLYIPIINGNKKCLGMDEKMKIVALVLRSVTDFAYIIHVIIRFLSALRTAVALKLSMFTRFPWLNLLSDIFAIIPFPQVIVLRYFSKIAGSRSLTARKILNFFLMFQYVPRILRVYLSAKALEQTSNSITKRAWIKGAFNFFLYIIVGHVFGALWYFFSIYRETACWHHACERYPGCVPGPFDCHGTIPLTNLTFINKICPVDPTNEKVFDFGIYVDAIESGILGTTNFLNKFSCCFWWGLRNLSSFGSNLETSSDTVENLFAVLISILGLILFLYLIGNVQFYMQLATKNSEKSRLKIMDKKKDIQSYLSNSSDKPCKHKEKLLLHSLRLMIKEGKDVDLNRFFSLIEDHKNNSQLPHQKNKMKFAELVNKVMDEHRQDTKEQQANLWIKYQNIPEEMSSNIMRFVKLGKQEGEDFDVGILLSIIPSTLGISVKKHLCLPILKKVPMLEHMDEKMYDTIYSYLKPVVYQENTYIIGEGEPLDFMLFITQGDGWTFGSSPSSNTPMKRLHSGNYYGIELLERVLKVTSYSEFPISTCNVKSQSKVEGFTLSSIDMETPELNKCLSLVPLHVEDARNAAYATVVARRLRRSMNNIDIAVQR